MLFRCNLITFSTNYKFQFIFSIETMASIAGKRMKKKNTRKIKSQTHKTKKFNVKQNLLDGTFSF